MKTPTLVLAFVFALCGFAPHISAQVCTSGVCSTAGMTFQGSTQECQEPQNPQPLWPFPAGGTQTWTMWVKNGLGTQVWSYSATQAVPMVANSTPPINGQCWRDATQWDICPGVWENQTVWVTDGNTGNNYYEFYLRGYGANITSSGCIKGGSYYGQVYQTANVVCCTSPPPCTGCGSCRGCQPEGCSSPIVVDVFDEGLHLTSLADGVSFDFNGNGKPLFMSWTDASYHNAWLALDRDRSGTIDNVNELFGSPTQPQIPSLDGKRNGWLALAIYDGPTYGGNGDGVIDSQDAVFSDLLLWIDENHDGISQPQELHHVQEMGVKGIELRYKENKSYKDAFGNTFQFESFVTVGAQDKNGEWEERKRQAWDVLLNASETPPGGPQPNVFCSLTPKNPRNRDLGLDADGGAPLGAFTLCALIGE